MTTKGEMTITMRALKELERKLIKRLEAIRCTIALFEKDNIASEVEQANVETIYDTEQPIEEVNHDNRNEV